MNDVTQYSYQVFERLYSKQAYQDVEEVSLRNDAQRSIFQSRPDKGQSRIPDWFDLYEENDGPTYTGSFVHISWACRLEDEGGDDGTQAWRSVPYPSPILFASGIEHPSELLFGRYQEDNHE
ncbi:hypothetical protein N7492_007758 [Penicillium capsulatum]|uniref:Uncharacterized protein n=1 Tax=Penicillium capsulatum TaxID=69766 RepID=A0A9W9I2V1_9EURO|nr:hypothetical protein N7492_007758 [Penicillium capsulatum]KAJ6117590.1 hypothetical protein N7512_007315 [Penicillium capsulatum]